MIGIAGSEEKCSILTEQLGFDVAINYNKQNIKVADQIFAFRLSQDNCHFTLTMKWQGHIICCFDKAQIHQKDSGPSYLIPVSSATSCSKRCTLLLWQCGRRYFSGAAKQKNTNKIVIVPLLLLYKQSFKRMTQAHHCWQSTCYCIYDFPGCACKHGHVWQSCCVWGHHRFS